jgi:outer membrane protein assembly factor BamB
MKNTAHSIYCQLVFLLLTTQIFLVLFGHPAMAQTTTDSAKQAAPEILPGKGLKQYDFFYAGEDKSRKMYIVRRGKVVWSYIDTMGKGEISDATLLPNGNVLFAHQFGITLIDKHKQVLWNYDAPKGFETHTAQLIGNDHVIFVQNGVPAKVIVMNIHDNTITKEFEIPASSGVHGQVRHARLTSTGTYLIAHMGMGKICEYDSSGKQLLSIDFPGVWSAIPLENGHILVTNNSNLVKEITRRGDEVWEYKLDQLPGYSISSPQLSIRLPNGNTLINNWFNKWDSHLDAANAPVQAIEVTPDKRIVWALRSWTDPYDLGPSTTIQLLNKSGRPVGNVHFGDIR